MYVCVVVADKSVWVIAELIKPKTLLDNNTQLLLCSGVIGLIFVPPAKVHLILPIERTIYQRPNPVNVQVI